MDILNKITLKKPENKASVELNNKDVFAFFKGYREGYSDTFAHKGDNYAPYPVVFEWDSNVSSTFTLTVWRKGNEQSKQVFTANELMLPVYTLIVEGEYRWFVQAQTADGSITSDIFSFALSLSLGTVFIEGVSNTRDIGGFLGFEVKLFPVELYLEAVSLIRFPPRGKSMLRAY